MIEAVAAGARALGVLASAHLIGTCVFLLRAGRSEIPILNSWCRALVASLPLAALLLVLMLLLSLVAQAAQISGGFESALSSELLLSLAQDTYYGRVWSCRVALASVLFVLAVVFFRRHSRESGNPVSSPMPTGGRGLRENWIPAPRLKHSGAGPAGMTFGYSGAALLVVLIPAAMVTAAAALSGHASGTENAGLLVPLHMLHVLALCAWLGGLPAWISLARCAALNSSDAVQRYAGLALKRFSSMAMLCMSLIILSGGVLAWNSFDTEGDLFGTRYGLLLCAKLILLAMVLLIANRVRLGLLPQLDSATSGPALFQGARQVGLEMGLGLCILGLGGWLAQTTPALHDEPTWWLPFRLSFDATWIDPSSRLAMIGGGVSAIVALVTLALLSNMRIPCRRGSAPTGTRRSNRAAHFERLSGQSPSYSLLRDNGVAMAAGLVLTLGSATALWGLSVPAYPDTFRRPAVQYLTLSIAQGQASFQAHCVSCHGTGGLGNGPLAASLPRPPANLSQPHTALHTAGDMYWWFTHGIPKSGMPGFAEQLDDEQRWDLANFLRAFSQGFQARVLGAEIVPNKPWLGAPNFYYDTADGGRAELKDLRRLRPVLVVFPDPSDPRSSERLAALRGLSLTGLNLAVIAPESADAWQAYQLFTRTLADRGSDDRIGMQRRHTEFLIDRFGYVRARWIPANEALGWGSRFELKRLVAALQQESEILPPPDLHLH